MPSYRGKVKQKSVMDFKIKVVKPEDGGEFHFGVGTGVIVVNETHPGCVLLGKRLNSDGEGKWALPGGHLEFGERVTECASRELEEECGIVAVEPRLLCWDESLDLAVDYHYVTAFVVVTTDSEPRNMEPEKCEGWEWKRWDELGALELFVSHSDVAKSPCTLLSLPLLCSQLLWARSRSHSARSTVGLTPRLDPGPGSHITLDGAEEYTQAWGLPVRAALGHGYGRGEKRVEMDRSGGGCRGNGGDSRGGGGDSVSFA